MLRQNSELRPHRIWNWTLPAWYVTLEDGTRFHTCPNAGICAQFCYARNGTYLFKNVLKAHTDNLKRVIEAPALWQKDMADELNKKKYRPTGVPRELPDVLNVEDLEPEIRAWLSSGGAAIRIHDSGDFFASWYLDLWIELADWFPDVLFYAYTKEVSMLKGLDLPWNFRIIFSTGGLEDHLIDPDLDRHADVFQDDESLMRAGYTSQDASDLLAVLLPTTKIGIPANNIRHFNKRLNGRRFSEVVPVRLRMKT